MLTSKLPQICKQAERDAQTAVEKAGLRIEAGAKVRSRYRTGFMRGEMQWIPGPGPHEGQMVAPASYTIYHELGTRYMSAQPMLAPATEEARPLFVADLRDAYRVT